MNVVGKKFYASKLRIQFSTSLMVSIGLEYKDPNFAALIPVFRSRLYTWQMIMRLPYRLENIVLFG